MSQADANWVELCVFEWNGFQNTTYWLIGSKVRKQKLVHWFILWIFPASLCITATRWALTYPPCRHPPPVLQRGPRRHWPRQNSESPRCPWHSPGDGDRDGEKSHHGVLFTLNDQEYFSWHNDHQRSTSKSQLSSLIFGFMVALERDFTWTFATNSVFGNGCIQSFPRAFVGQTTFLQWNCCKIEVQNWEYPAMFCLMWWFSNLEIASFHDQITPATPVRIESRISGGHRCRILRCNCCQQDHIRSV
jgi:hypothetical protein